MLDALDLVEIPWAVLGAVEDTGQFLVQDFVYQGALAGAGDSGDAHQSAQGNLYVDVLEVVLPCALDGDVLAVAVASSLGNRNLAEAAQVLTGDGLRGVDDILHRSGGDDMASVLASAGADVHDVVGGTHDGFVVLDDDYSVAQVSQSLQGLDEPVIVGGVQPDGRLVADVQHTHESGAYLGRQPYALGLASAES